MKVLWGEVAIALHPRQCAPAARLLDSPEVHPGHDEPTRERVPVTVPGVALELARVVTLGSQ